jgi:hypothetical protein
LELDKRWFARILGGSVTLEVQSVGEGPYALVEVMTCEGEEERTLRYIGFDSAAEAAEIADFMKAQASQPERQSDASPSERRIRLAKRIEHIWEHMRFDVVCMAPAERTASLDSLLWRPPESGDLGQSL